MIDVNQVDNIKKIKEELLSHFPTDVTWYQDILKLAFNFTEKGNHKNNLYHNPYHCYIVANQSLIYLKNSKGSFYDFHDESPNDVWFFRHILSLILAALFHDYDHSGKPLSVVEDRININRALMGLMKFQIKVLKIRHNPKYITPDILELDMAFELAAKAIKSTLVELRHGEIIFRPQPKSFLSALLRDADLSMMLCDPGLHLIKGLATELNKNFDFDFKAHCINFIKNATLYTSYAQQLRNDKMDYLENIWLNE